MVLILWCFRTSPDDVKTEDILPSIVKELKPYISKELLRRLKIWFVSGFIVLVIITCLTTIYTLKQMYYSSIKYLSTIVNASVEEEFKTERIGNIMENVASIQSQKYLKENVIPIINKFNESTNKRVDNFNEHINVLRADVENEYKGLKNQVEYIKQHNSILKIADRAILPNGANEYRQLTLMYLDQNLEKEIKELIRSQLNRIKLFYISFSRIRGVELEIVKEDGGKKKNNELTTDEIIAFLDDEDFKKRAKAAQLLSNRKEKKVPDFLFQKIFYDEDLEVIKLANKSFSKITGFKAEEIPNFPPAEHITWWNENKENILKTLK